ncbi:MAG TPA: hypothetical protein PLF50_00415 [Candidatus Cloacimonadota bacterium]|nr:hypothetical protein [Candidatus Cloacimonadota bacterium]
MLTLGGDVYDSVYTSLPLPSPTAQSIGGVLLKYPSGDSLFTDQSGWQTIPDNVYLGLRVKLDCDVFYVVKYSDSTIVECDTILISGNQLTPEFYDNNARTANAYYHAYHQQQFINNLVNDETRLPWRLKIITNDSNVNGGIFDPNSNSIDISTASGKLSHVVRHELSHANTYNILWDNLFANSGGDSNKAMDEACAEYLPCISNMDSLIYNPNDDGVAYSSDLLADGNTMWHIHGLYHPDLVGYCENDYSLYKARRTIAAAWYELQNILPSRKILLTLQQLTTNAIGSQKRYVPRTFFNLLMRDANTDPSYKTLNANQMTIIDKYNSRKLFFSPKVEVLDAQ